MACHDGMDFSERALVDSRRRRMVWIGSKNPHPFNRRFIYLARGANVKMLWLLTFARRMEDGPYWEQKTRSPTFMGAGHYLADIQDLGKNPPCNAEDNTELIIIEAWFSGY